MPPQVTGSGTCFATLCTHVWLIFIVYNANMSLHISLLFERSVTHWTQIIHRHRQTWKYKRKQITNIANSIYEHIPTKQLLTQYWLGVEPLVGDERWEISWSTDSKCTNTVIDSHV